MIYELYFLAFGFGNYQHWTLWCSLQPWDCLQQGFSFVSCPYMILSWRPLLSLAMECFTLGADFDFETMSSKNIQWFMGLSNEAKDKKCHFYGTVVLLYMLRKYMVGYAQVWVTQKWPRRGRKMKDVQIPKFWKCLPSGQPLQRKFQSKWPFLKNWNFLSLSPRNYYLSSSVFPFRW